ncbi:U32 family peptidase [uncultured Ferrovibrio sp.]|jgi:Collagenase and related proteases|uniref:ubiquinone anaerobic biosynthesis protein UbiV n=1 Tax=uncultured Ferrovibrio sp. TaxID=1576913 RepID=UPI0026057226|nr:U32 family peptidase [uncultured Ferrovibrio sp.]
MSATLTLGPVLFHWPAERLLDFYARIADEAPVDIVHVGEIVCSKRAPFVDPVLPEIIERLRRGGKTVVLSSRALVMTERESRMMTEQIAMAETPDMLIEANDLGAVRSLAGRPHVIGPFINVYNEGTLDYLVRQGAMRVCLPPELPGTAIAALAKVSSVPLEVLVFGRMPLAISARCFHARAHGLHKDSCRYMCGNDPDGRSVKTLDGEAFLAINGTQTMSHTCLNLSGEIPGLMEAGIRHFRLSPQDTDMVAVISLFRRIAEQQIDPAEASRQLASLAKGLRFSNGFIHGREGRAILQARFGHTQ